MSRSLQATYIFYEQEAPGFFDSPPASCVGDVVQGRPREIAVVHGELQRRGGHHALVFAAALRAIRGCHVHAAGHHRDNQIYLKGAGPKVCPPKDGNLCPRPARSSGEALAASDGSRNCTSYPLSLHQRRQVVSSVAAIQAVEMPWFGLDN